MSTTAPPDEEVAKVDDDDDDDDDDSDDDVQVTIGDIKAHTEWVNLLRHAICMSLLHQIRQKVHVIDRARLSLFGISC